MKTRIIATVLVFLGWNAFAQHDHSHQATEKKMEQAVMFKDASLGKAYSQYIQLKDALVASKMDEAKKGGSLLLNTLGDVNGSTAVKAEVSRFLEAADLSAQRKVFSSLSNEMAALVKGGKLSGGSLYLEFCPMANGNAGAYWLSNEKEIRNPYFGDKMLRCGSVKETINQ
ncbi:MAG: DUF3347 domain-containing protein [Cytophagales bacterium]|nr:DUF3347 domain-containing protein [Cytophagales bacterium]